MIQKRFVYFDSIPAEPKMEMILTRLGYRRNTTTLNDEQMVFLEDGVRKGMFLCHSKGVYGRFKIENNDGKRVTLENQQIFESASLCKLLKKSTEVVLMASTVGSEVVEEAGRQIKEWDPALGIIIDSVASQTADAAVAWIMEFVNKAIRREGKAVTKHRYSPGFGDLLLENQKLIFDMLELSKLEIRLTERFMLIPEKSVIAIAGIEYYDNE